MILFSCLPVFGQLHWQQIPCWYKDWWRSAKNVQSVWISLHHLQECHVHHRKSPYMAHNARGFVLVTSDDSGILLLTISATFQFSIAGHFSNISILYCWSFQEHFNSLLLVISGTFQFSICGLFNNISIGHLLLIFFAFCSGTRIINNTFKSHYSKKLTKRFGTLASYIANQKCSHMTKWYEIIINIISLKLSIRLGHQYILIFDILFYGILMFAFTLLCYPITFTFIPKVVKI